MCLNYPIFKKYKSFPVLINEWDIQSFVFGVIQKNQRIFLAFDHILT